MAIAMSAAAHAKARRALQQSYVAQTLMPTLPHDCLATKGTPGDKKIKKGDTRGRLTRSR